MRTLLAGLEVVRRTPLAFLPASLESLLAAALMTLGAFPADAAVAPAAAVFPFGIYFDLKQSLAAGSAWSYVAASAGVGAIVRSASLAASLWLADGARVPFVLVWGRAVLLAAVAPLALLPAAVLHFTGYALRYAPFVLLGAALGVPVAFAFARRAVALDAGRGSAGGRPGLGEFLAYAYFVALNGAALAVLGRGNTFAAAVFLLLLGPLHALVLLGWREAAQAGAPARGAWVAGATAAALVLFLGVAAFDRSSPTPSPTSENRRGRLLLLRGVDSTSRRGPLSKLHARSLGFAPRRAVVLSYRGLRGPYGLADTHVDLLQVARAVGRQIGSMEPPNFLLGHSQAALILDRVLVEGLPAPDSAVVLAAPPPWPPAVSVPPPGERAPGRPAAEAARALSRLLDAVGLAPFDIDTPASPPHLRPVVVPEPPIPRLAVWALGDSVWLDSDWRRPGEVNVVALTDHTGVTRNAFAFDVANLFVGGREVAGQEVSWQGLLVVVLRYAFEPWRA